VTEDYTETIEVDEPTAPEPEKPEQPYHTLFEVWRAVLEPARNGGLVAEPVTPRWATKIVNTYHGLSYADTHKVHVLLFDMVDRMAHVLDEVIAEHPKCLSPTDAAEDVEENSETYLDLLIRWQTEVLQRELEWRATDDDAAVMVAVLSEVHTMFFGDTGLSAHLDSIKFEFTEADQQTMHDALEQTRNEYLDSVKGQTSA
jgi:hypothetical protein